MTAQEDNVQPICLIKIPGRARPVDSALSLIAWLNREQSDAERAVMDCLKSYAKRHGLRVRIVNARTYEDHWDLEFASLLRRPRLRLQMTLRMQESHTEWKLWRTTETAQEKAFAEGLGAHLAEIPAWEVTNYTTTLQPEQAKGSR